MDAAPGNVTTGGDCAGIWELIAGSGTTDMASREEQEAEATAIFTAIGLAESVAA